MPKQLSGLDATFLYLESPEQPMHVGALHHVTLPPGYKGSFVNAVRKHVQERLHLAGLFTNKLAFMPFGMGHPVWLHEPHVDLTHHIHVVKLPKPGTDQQLIAAAAKQHSQLLDHSKPLWQFTIYEGLKDGSVAFSTKMHHAALDGKGAIVLANALLDLTPEPREVKPVDPGAKPKRTEMKVGEMIGAVFSNTLAQYAKIAQGLPAAASMASQALASQGKSAAKSALKTAANKRDLNLGPRTLFNKPVSNTRAFATAELPFAELRGAAKAASGDGSGSLNDAVLFVCSTALRLYLQHHKALPKTTLVAAMPVSLREESNKDLNNQASMTLVELGTHLSDPQKRFAAIMTSTAKVKTAMSSMKSLMPTDYPSLFAPWLVGGVSSAYSKLNTRFNLAERMPVMANLVISNVPGPPVPLYLAGAQLKSFHPMSIIVHGVALNITVQSYSGKVDFGLLACGKAVPDVKLLAQGLQTGFDELMVLAKAASPTAPVVSTKVSTKTAAKKRAVSSAAKSKP
jgi:diacylglycerol O-acyltransferase / wax synthase